MRERTRMLHYDGSRDPLTGASSTPIYQTSTFTQADPEHLAHYDYARSGNPTRTALETLIAGLEDGRHGYAFGSGMAAISSALLLFQTGDHLIVSEDIYGGSFRVLTTIFERWGLQTTFVDMTDPDAVSRALTPRTRGILVETPSNPLLKITHLEWIGLWAGEHGLLRLIDNTFMTPYLQKPLRHGFDIVLHSATKFLAGHSDVIAGLAVVQDDTLGRRLRQIQNAFGAILGPQDSWLVARGIKTLAPRLDVQQASAVALAEWMQAQPSVRRVHFPGRTSHTGHAIHAGQSAGPGAVLAFELESGPAAVAFMKAVKVPLVAVSLGGVESILSYPTTMSHAAMPASERLRRGITPALMRLSVGLEDVNDLKEDFAQAFRRVAALDALKQE